MVEMYVSLETYIKDEYKDLLRASKRKVFLQSLVIIAREKMIYIDILLMTLKETQES